MITPRHFEEFMQEIEYEQMDYKTKLNKVIKIMADTLDTLGYAAGANIARRMSYADERYED